ncbi:xanthine dehydrogenase family protein molybdopterin-binding subunit [Pseudomonas sp. GD03858]|uniref:xanthine dehydrogenase family protein molybdopterin-binding subunit n=1 Tax=unclassified Pseudomonas TaxID=196821 RepID=UPI002448E47C|nr:MULTISPECIES: xanthine dehydrogenase family protein molybdopterin-binding subunit [unclassified Pseudomonas]MDH0646943.1 xanthine dehydrogenase family protein molybdopterin-binding subunit [Pseudomonas sp. GD03867]MDH0662714.1 xanthine dehydrogenase family protein molybdopterin-binding subunit [Pseudomonas sp. GD03858]
MSNRDISRRSFLQGGLIAGVGVTLAPLGSQAFAALMESKVTTSPQKWMNHDGKARFRNDALSKVCGSKVFARDIRAKDMPGWPQQQGHAMLLKATKADRIYAGYDLSLLGSELQPDRIVTAEDLKKDGIAWPEAHSPDPLLPPGQVPMFIGHPVAILIWNDFERFRKAKLKLQFNDKAIRYGAQAPLYQRDPYGSFRFVRVGGKTPFDEDEYSSLKNTMLFPTILARKPVWTAEPKQHGNLTEQGMFYAQRIDQQLKQPPEDWLLFDERYKTPSIEPAALEPDNGNGWFDPATGTLHFVVATQCPFEVAQECVHMIKPSRFGLKHLNMHPGYTVGYGSKDNNIFVFYAAVAALYGAGVPIRLANDRYEQFQSGIKRHPFDIRYQLAVDKKDMSFQIFRADMTVDGGGRINYSPSVAAVGATAAQSIYYMPQNDLAVTAYHSRGVEAGSMRGYGTLQSMAATEMMVDEIADRLGVDAIELRRKNALKSGMKNTQGAVPAGALRLHEILDKAAEHDWWKQRHARKQAEDAKDHDNWYGVGFAITQKDFGTGSEAPMAAVEFGADGHIILRHIGTELGTGMSTSQALVVSDFLGRVADEVKTAQTEWPELALTTSGNPYLISQAEQDAALRDPRWVGKLASPSSATNSAFYFSHATREAARVLFNHGLWPAAMALWSQGPFGGQANPLVVRRENAVWVNGELTGNGLAPIPFATLAKKAHEMGLVTAVSVHGFNRWSWAEADFVIDGVRERLPLDAVAVKYGDGAVNAKKAQMNSAGFHLLDRQNAEYPATQLNNAMVTYYSPVATIVEVKVNKGSGEVTVLNHHSWVECGRVLVPELVKGQLEGGIAMGIGHALLEEMPLYEGGPGEGNWNFNRYRLPMAKHVAVWKQTSEILPPLSPTDPSKGIAEVVMIPVVGAIGNAVAHAIGKRVRDLPITPARVKEALNG